MKKYIDLVRIKQWVKNVLVFVPMVCAGSFNNANVFTTIGGFFSFSLMASFIYVINDIRDIEKDKLHPRKKKRPLASGKIGRKTAIAIAVSMLVLALILNYICIYKTKYYSSFIILLAYAVINLAYSFGFKNVPVVDICLLATGFVLRVYYGASLLNIEVSSWLFLTIMSASLFLGLGKRKKEFLTNKESRKVLDEYNESFLTNFLYLCLVLTLTFYSLWAIEQDNRYIIFTVPLLIIIFMKYCLIMEKSDEGDPTTILYQDKILLFLCSLYGIAMIVLLVVI